jgi:hypothetical protein
MSRTANASSRHVPALVRRHQLVEIAGGTLKLCARRQLIPAAMLRKAVL